jgi:hypothetical protein
MPQIAKYGWPARWRPVPDSPAEGRAAGVWRADEAAFSIDGTAKDLRWLRYHHQTPTYEQWQAVSRGATLPADRQLITDLTAYDMGNIRFDLVGPGMNLPADQAFLHWVGDLAVESTAATENFDGTLVYELRKGGRRFQCQFDLSTGQATLSISGDDVAAWRPTASTAVRGQGRHKILFSNCDNQLRLWVDGELITFDRETTYPDLGNVRPDAADRAPVGIASAGAAVRIDHLRVLRDIYYVADIATEPWRGRCWNVEKHDLWYSPARAVPDQAQRPLSMPTHVDFVLDKNQFFAMGDNSPKSKDGRLWGPDRYWVPRDLLIGKALLIYWPHSWDRLPYFNRVPCPYFPNFARMGLVR